MSKRKSSEVIVIELLYFHYHEDLEILLCTVNCERGIFVDDILNYGDRVKIISLGSGSMSLEAFDRNIWSFSATFLKGDVSKLKEGIFLTIEMK